VCLRAIGDKGKTFAKGVPSVAVFVAPGDTIDGVDMEDGFLRWGGSSKRQLTQAVDPQLERRLVSTLEPIQRSLKRAWFQPSSL
jgi:hypothetical protein